MKTFAGDWICSLNFLSGEKNGNSTHPTYIPTLNICQEKILRPWPVQQSSLSAVLNGGQLERNADVANLKKWHKSPASLSIEELSLLSIVYTYTQQLTLKHSCTELSTHLQCLHLVQQMFPMVDHSEGMLHEATHIHYPWLRCRHCWQTHQILRKKR